MASYERTGTPGIYRRGETYSVAFRHPITRKTTFRTAGRTLREAKALKRQLEEQRERGISSPDGQLTFGALWADYQQFHLGTLSPSTRADYLSVANRYLLPRYRLAQVGAIDRTEVLRFREELQRTKSSTTGRVLSPKRVRNILVCLQSVFQFAVEANHAWSNPVRGMRRPSLVAPAKRRVALTPEQSRVLLDAVSLVNPDPRYRTMVHLMLHTGARLGETLAMRVGQLSLENRTVRIDRSVYRGVEKLPKTSAGIRTVGISSSLLRALESYLETIPHESDDLLFPSKRSRCLDANAFRRYVFDRAKVKARELDPTFPEDLVIHGLRHSFCSWMSELPIEVGMELAGHSSPSVHLGYRHAGDAAARGAQALNALE